MEPIVFVNIGWMKRYQGPTADDELEPGNFGYFKGKERTGSPKVGHEQWNFLARDGRVQGYVPRSASINITRLGAVPGDQELEGVLVVFVARDPVADVLKVVGWYWNATVCRDMRFVRSYGETRVEAPISADASDWYLLPVADRGEPIIPTAQRTPGGVGQSPIWYAESHPEIVAKVRKLVAAKRMSSRQAPRRSSKSGSGFARNSDPIRRLKIEKQAMEWALAYFDGARDVSDQKLGWDIEADSSEGVALIEVKGLSGPDVAIELTPNEYANMKARKGQYILFVLTAALSKHPQARTFRFQGSGRGQRRSDWVSDKGEVLKIQERTGARCSV